MTPLLLFLQPLKGLARTDAYLIWVALSLDEREDTASSVRPTHAGGAAAIVLLVFIQIVLGAFVAGLKAGASYNTWPLMDGRLVPDGLGSMQPWYLNLFENALAVQFNHRLVAYAVWAFAVVAAIAALRARALAGPLRTLAVAVALAATAQAGLGIAALTAGVPVALGMLHQAGAALLLGLATAFAWRARRP